MNILITHWGDLAIRGSEKVLIDVSEGMGKRNHNVHVLCNQKNLAHILTAHCTSVSIFASSNNGLISGISDYARNVAQALKIIRSNKIDIVIANNLGTSRWVSVAALLANCKLISYVHTNYLPWTRLSSLVHLSDAVMGVSDFVLKDFIEDGFDEEKIFKIWNGTGIQDPLESKESIRRELGLSDEAIVALSIGAFVPFKRFEIFLESSTIIASKNESYVAMICGDGHLKSTLESEYAKPSIRFLGWRNDVARLIKASDFLVSCSAREAFGLSIIEAAAIGRPSVVANRGGQVEIVHDNITGLHFEADSIDACVEVIEKMIASPSLRDDQGARAREAFLTHFTIDQMIFNIERCLHVVKNKTKWESHRLKKVVHLFKSSFRLIMNRLLQYAKSY